MRRADDRADDARPTYRECLLAGAGGDDLIATAIANSARSTRLNYESEVEPGIRTVASSVVGPLFTAFVLWVVRDAAQRGATAVHFLARDGQIMVPIAQQIADWLGVDIRMTYTLASRQAFLMPALPVDSSDREFVEAALELAYYDEITLEEFLAALRLGAQQRAEVAQHSGLGLDVPASACGPQARSALSRALLAPGIVSILRRTAVRERSATLAYLEEVGAFEAGEFLVVDLGWRGTTQRRLRHLLGDRVRIVGYYLGLGNCVLDDSDIAQAWPAERGWKTSLLEALATCDHTTLRSFVPDGDAGWVCDPPIEEDTAAIEWGARQQQEMAAEFTRHLLATISADSVDLDEFQRMASAAAITSYRHFSRTPTRAEAQAYGALVHDARSTHNGGHELAPAVTSLQCLRHLRSQRERAQVSRWYEGSLVRSRAVIPLALATVLRGVDQVQLRQIRRESPFSR
ncbi:hypothetical protein [Branchiibius sp. NY16-3462-2]|uniref:hypothetical protein n=1 Tax=Branchiibius sp. NY16-3462-2 TaxID=1807500 RepID=UPI0025C0CCB2|nr:hypothetical protein [Branchiibius sp. NY16-3462-2]